MLKEFREFALRGNMVDLAIGVIIGAAFGAIVNSLVADIFMPIIGAITGGFDFSNHFLALSSKVTAASLDEARKQGAVVAWGHFITLLLNFLIVAWVIFLVVKLMNNLKRRQAAAPQKAPEQPPEVVLLTEIRDLLKQQKAAG